MPPSKSGKSEGRRSKPKIVLATAHEPVDPWLEAVDHLRGLDPRWSKIIDEVGPCRLTLRPDRFGTLVRAIVGQQISAKAATSIDRRLREVGGEPHSADRLIDLGEEKLRSVGLSGVKAQYVLNLSHAVRDGRVPLDEIHLLTDEEIIAALTSVKGIGRWTAEMFLIFALGRPDVLSAGDLGIRVGLQRFHGLEEMPKPSECQALTDAWRPYRTVAMWYLWEQIDNPKKTKSEDS